MRSAGASVDSGGRVPADDLAGGSACPVIRMISTMTNARPTISQVCTCRGSTPCGATRESRTRAGSLVGGSGVEGSMRASLANAGKREMALPDDEVAAVEDLGHDVEAVLDLEVHEVRDAIAHLVER